MTEITIHPLDQVRDFYQIAELFTTEQGEPVTEAGLRAKYSGHEGEIWLKVAVDSDERLLGFYRLTRSRVEGGRAYVDLIVAADQRKQGIGSRLYEDLIFAAEENHFSKLWVEVQDSCQVCLDFAVRRGFTERLHQIAMELDLTHFDDRPYHTIIERLAGEGFMFTSMAKLGNCEKAQRMLYQLNNATDLDTPGSDGVPSWESFEDFQNSVCRSNWYRPEGQIIAIDTVNDYWVAMSAITRFDGQEFGYNLHTGVDRGYRGRKLAQAVKVLALRYAHKVLRVNSVRTHHNTLNHPMIAIDRKFGYVQKPGIYVMVKSFDQPPPPQAHSFPEQISSDNA